MTARRCTFRCRRVTSDGGPGLRLRSHRGARRRDGGFTLVELIATMTVLSVIGLAASGLIVTATDSYVEASTAARLHGEASVAMDRIVRELRAIPNRAEEEANGPDLDAVRSDRISWGDGSSIRLDEQRRLVLTIDGGDANVLLENVATFEVEAFDAEGAALAATLNWPATASVQRIGIMIETSDKGVQDRIRSLAFIRSTISTGNGGDE